MPRQERIHYSGALYHVICRGNNKSFVFNLDEWKEKYIELIIKYKRKFSFKLFAFVIMDNHVHLLIQVEETPLGKIMQGIQQSFTQRYNKAFRRSGHVFEQRYKSILCDKDEYLLALVRYIHQNPFRIGKPEGLRFAYSSYLSYLKTSQDLVDTNEVMMYFGNDLHRFCEYMEEEECRLKWLNQKDYSDPIENEMEVYRTRQENIDRDTVTLDEIIKLVVLYFEFDEKRLLEKSQQTMMVRIKSIVAYLSAEQGNIKIKDIASRLNMSANNVSSILSNSAKRELLLSQCRQISSLRGLTR